MRDEALAATARYKFAHGTCRRKQSTLKPLTCWTNVWHAAPNHSLAANAALQRGLASFLDLKRFDEAMEEASRVLAGYPPAARAQECPVFEGGSV